MNPVMATFFDALGDGVVIVNPQGVVQYANGAGSRLFKPVVGKPFPDARILKALFDLVAGYVEAPAHVATESDRGTSSKQVAQVMPLPIPNTFAVTLQDVQERSFYETTLKNFFDFMAMDLAGPLERFVRQAEAITRKLPDAFPTEQREAIAALAAEAQTMGSGFQRMHGLSQLFRTALLVDRERLPIATMIKEVLDAESRMIGSKRLRLHLDGLDQELPPVYGSRPWLTQALRELIANAARYSREESQLEIALRCTGTHVILYFRNHGLFASRQLNEKTIFVPFHMVAQYIKEKKMPAKALVGKLQEETPRGGPGLGLPMCERILALHGGSVALRSGDDNVEFTLEIPTGAPSQGDEALDIQQAQRYAKDMATIMQRMRRKRSDSGGISPSS